MDNNATTAVAPEVLEAMLPFLRDRFANPSSTHGPGRQVRRMLELAREQVAALIGAEPDEVVFTSGGTEANNLAIKGCAALSRAPAHIITSAIEHPAVLATCQELERQGWQVSVIPTDSGGVVDMDALKGAVRDDTYLISVQLVNNEIGTIQPCREIGRLARDRGIYFHCDAVQAAGKMQIDVEEICADFLSVAAHKFHGPKGAGALFVRRGGRLIPLQHGGGQERSHRSGTENVPAYVGMGAAASLAQKALPWVPAFFRDLRDYLCLRLTADVPDWSLNGDPERSTGGTVNLSFKGVRAESLQADLSMKGIAVSVGAACSSGQAKISHVLTSLGLSQDAIREAIRISFGRYTTTEELDLFVSVLAPSLERLRRVSAVG